MRMSSTTSPPRAIAWRVRAVWRSGGAEPREPVAGRRGRAARVRTRVGSSPSSKNDKNCSNSACQAPSMPIAPDCARSARKRAPSADSLQAARSGPRTSACAAGSGRRTSCTVVGERSRREEAGAPWRRTEAVRTVQEPTEPTAAPGPDDGGESRRVLGRYRLARRIGSGGFGVVWLAEDERLQRAVAVKRIVMHDAAVAARAEREGRAAARLSHPGIVALYESGRDEEAVYLVSELVRGRTLAELMEEGELSDRDVLRVGIALCDALSHAHGRGVIHRDVKPGNVIVPDRPHDGAGVAKLTD